MSALNLTLIATGGALGATSRYMVTIFCNYFFKTEFPISTLIVNLFGCFLMGIIINIFSHIWKPEESIRLFLTVGFLSSFTTFSAFSFDAFTLIEKGQVLLGISYTLASITLPFLGLILGYTIVLHLLS